MSGMMKDKRELGEASRVALRRDLETLPKEPPLRCWGVACLYFLPTLFLCWNLIVKLPRVGSCGRRGERISCRTWDDYELFFVEDEVRYCNLTAAKLGPPQCGRIC